MTAAPVSKLEFFEVHTRDVERLADYYEKALGLVPVQAGAVSYLTTGTEHHCVVVAPGKPNGRARLGFQLACSIDDAMRGLGAAGISFERQSDPEPGLADALQLAEPGTGTTITLYESQSPSRVRAGDAVRPTKLGHLAAYVRDLDTVRGFYENCLGFRWSDMVGEFFVFLRCNSDHHAINLLQSDKRSGLFHVAFEMRDMNHLKEMLDVLAAERIRLAWGPGRHGPGHNIFTYHRDPDGNIVELFCEIDIIRDETTGEFEPRPWHDSRPLRPRVWDPTDEAANRWGPLYPGFIDR